MRPAIARFTWRAARPAELTPAEVRNRHGAFIRRARAWFRLGDLAASAPHTVLAILLFAPDPFDSNDSRSRRAAWSDAIGSLGTRAELERALKLATYLKPAKAAAREIVTGNGRDPLKMAEAIRTKYGNRSVIIT